MPLIAEDSSLNRIIRLLPSKIAPIKLQPTFYRTLLAGPIAALCAQCDERPDVTSIAILGYN
jgi:hypothetical protein